MEIDLTILNNKSKIDVDGKVTFPKQDLEKAGILDMGEITVKGTLTNNEGYTLYLNIKNKMVLPCSLSLEPVEYPFDIK